MKANDIAANNNPHLSLCLALIEQAHADIAHHKRAYANSIQAQEMTSGQVYRLRCAEINSKSAKTFLKSGWVTEFATGGTADV